jgi:hypothetical protein
MLPLVLLAAAASTWLAYGMVSWLSREGVPVIVDWSIAFGGVTFAAAAMLMAFVVPLRLLLTIAPAELLGRHGASATFGRRWRQTLLAVQIALAAVLVSGALTAVAELLRISAINVGFSAAHIVTVRCGRTVHGLPEDACAPVITALREEASVASTAVSVLPPLHGSMSANVMSRHPQAPRTATRVHLNMVDSNYFATMGVKLLQGRNFGSSERFESRLVAVVNQSMANLFWPGESPLGKCFGPTTEACSITVIGVVQDSRYVNVLEAAAPYYFTPAVQAPALVPSALNVRVKDVSQVQPLVDKLKRMISTRDCPSGCDTDAGVRSVGADIAAVARPWRITAIVFFLLSGTTVALAIIGAVALIAGLVRQRRREFAIRRIIGAKIRDLRLLIMQDVGGAVLKGAICGGSLTSILRSYAPAPLATGTVTFTTVLAALLLTVLLLSVASLWATERSLRENDAQLLRTVM